MGKKKRQDDPWAQAKRVCRLNARQVQMAKELGMNPRKLPGLIPSRTQPWKAPVGVFIEQLHADRFGSPREKPAEAGHPSDSCATDPVDIVTHLTNLCDRLSALTAEGLITPADLLAVGSDLRQVAEEIESGQPVSQSPYADLDIEVFGGWDGLPSRRPDLEGELPF